MCRRFPIAVFMAAIFMAAFTYSAPVHANSIIELADHTISYEKGFIDPDTLNGTARNVVIRQKSNQDASMLIDDYTFVSTINGTVTTIDSLVLEGLVFIDEDQLKLVADSVTWTNGQIDGYWMDALTNRIPNQNASFTNLGEITMNNIMVSEAGATVLNIDSIYINAAEMPNNPFPNLPISDLSVEFRNIFMPLELSNDEDYIATLQDIGLDGIRFSFALAVKNADMQDRVNTNSTLFLAADELADIRMTLGIGTTDIILSELDRMMTSAYSDDIGARYLELMMVGLFFNNMDIIMTDKGVLDVVIDDVAAQNGVSRNQAISLMMDSVATAIGIMAPNTYRAIAPPLRNFLSESGTIYMGLNPSQPVPAASMLGILALPDQAKDLLGLSVNHTP